MDVGGGYDGCGLEVDGTVSAQRGSSSGKTAGRVATAHGGAGRRTGSTARAGAQRGTKHGPHIVGAGGGDDCRILEAGRMADDSGESRNGLAAGDEASGNGGTGLRLSGTARAQARYELLSQGTGGDSRRCHITTQGRRLCMRVSGY